MDGQINNYVLAAIIIYISYSAYRSHKKQQLINGYLKSLELNYPQIIKISGRVKFSRLHLLIDSDLHILHSDSGLLIHGFDYYSHRRKKFIFHTDKNFKTKKRIKIPCYLIINIEIVENEKIIITSENGGEITLLFRNSGKEKVQLKDEKFIALLNSLKNELIN
ncbi:hypothetical protein [Winogradskyella tangerina]|uniref:hypothetical protein n=1 Tax=Winogradskyella tangerina TaxID=2023240 RepID=UPI000DBEA20E|nr:hypothetical protein [Winogradskyella tangerina]